MAHTYVTLVHRNPYDTHILDMLLEVYKVFGTEGVNAKGQTSTCIPTHLVVLSTRWENIYMTPTFTETPNSAN